MASTYRNNTGILFRFYIVVLFFVIGQTRTLAQVDTLQYPKKDSVLAWDSIGRPTVVFDSSTFEAAAKPKPHNPKKATMRSLILPGWGQAYNKQYWKIPIVWGALAIPGAAYIKNNNWYRDAANVYNIVYSRTLGTANNAGDVSGLLVKYKDYQEYWDKLYAINQATAPSSFLSTVQSNRNFYRRNRDYSVLWLLILWGVNVADATVFGHLKDFDISPDLGMRINPTYMQATRTPGISILFNLK